MSYFRPAVLCGLVLCLAPRPLAAEGQPQLAASRPPMAHPLAGWQRREYREHEVVTPVAEGKPPIDTDRATWLALPITLPGRNEFVKQIEGPWSGRQRLEIDLYVSDPLPVDTAAYVFVKDWDSAWLQAPITLEPGHNRLLLPVAGAAATATWVPSGHGRPWHQLTPGQIHELGIKIKSRGDAMETFASTIYLGDVQLSGQDPEVADTTVTDLRLWPQAPDVGAKCEIAFEYHGPLHDPFTTADLDVIATVTGPDGVSEQFRGFYYEDFLYDETDRQGRLLPHGYPEIRVRCRARQPGLHQVSITARIGDNDVAVPELHFTAREPALPWRGPLQVSTVDPQRLAFSMTGGEFHGVGLNVRSPFDTRYVDSFPFSSWEQEDLNLYQRLLPRYEEAGINVIEVWMSAWWMGLEWIPDAPGYHGIGFMNQWRAWKLDRILQWARERDIYVILLFNNHGRFSTFCDQTCWLRSPFNAANGGALADPTRYFSDPASKAAFRKFADYVIARWGYSDHILAWKLFSEIDLTGHNRAWYKDEAVRLWHQEMGDYVKSIDPLRHMITTHWATDYKMINRPLASLPQLDLVTLDAYYNQNEPNGAQRFFNLVQESVAALEPLHKPAIITEFGGSPWADSTPAILRQLHLSLWAGFFGKMAAGPCFWWFPLVDEMDLYDEYRVFADFARGEALAGSQRHVSRLADEQLTVCRLARDNSCWLWVFDDAYFFSDDLHATPTEHQHVEIRLPALRPGNYYAEIIACQDGRTLQQQQLEILPGAQPQLTLPRFTYDVAVKVKMTP